MDIQNYLIESIKQNNDTYRNTINATHPYPCGICKKTLTTIKKLFRVQTVNIGYTLNVTVHL